MSLSKKQEPAGLVKTSAAQAEMALVERAKGGDRQAFEELVLRYQDRVFSTAVRILGNREDALEASQETFLKAFRALPRFDGRSSFYTWLFRVAINAARSHRRSAARRKERSMAYHGNGDSLRLVELVDGREKKPLDAVLARERREIVTRAIADLDGESAEMIVLKDIQGMRYEEIAEVLHCPLGSVKSRLFRARNKLRRKLEGILG